MLKSKAFSGTPSVVEREMNNFLAKLHEQNISIEIEKSTSSITFFHNAEQVFVMIIFRSREIGSGKATRT